MLQRLLRKIGGGGKETIPPRLQPNVDYSLPPNPGCGLTFFGWLRRFALEQELPINHNDPSVKPVLIWIEQNFSGEPDFATWLASLRNFIAHNINTIEGDLLESSLYVIKDEAGEAMLKQRSSWLEAQLKIVDSFITR